MEANLTKKTKVAIPRTAGVTIQETVLLSSPHRHTVYRQPSQRLEAYCSDSASVTWTCTWREEPAHNRTRFGSTAPKTSAGGDHDALRQVVEDGGSEGENLPADHRVRQSQADEEGLEGRQRGPGRHAEAPRGDAEGAGGPLGDGVGDGLVQVHRAGVSANQGQQV